MIAEHRLEIIAQRFDELTDELNIPELLTLSQDMQSIVDEVGRLRQTLNDALEEAYRARSRMERDDRGRISPEERYRREKLDAMRYAYQPVLNNPNQALFI